MESSIRVVPTPSDEQPFLVLLDDGTAFVSERPGAHDAVRAARARSHRERVGPNGHKMT